MISKKQILLLFVSIVIFSVLTSINFSGEPIGMQQGKSANRFEGWAYRFHIDFVKSHIYYGLRFTKGQDIFYETKEPYKHHPPGLGLLLTATYTTFGFKPVIARGLGLIFYIGIMTISILLLKESFRKNKRLLLFYVLILSIIPISTVYGKHIPQLEGSIQVFLILFTAHFYIKRIRDNYVSDKKQTRIIIIGSVLASFYSEAGILFVVLLCANEIFIAKKKDKFRYKLILSYIIILVFMCAQLMAVTHSFNIVDEFVNTLENYEKEESKLLRGKEFALLHLQVYTPLVTVLAIAGVIFYIFLKKHKEEKEIWFATKLLVIFYFSYLFIFYYASYKIPLNHMIILPIEVYFAAFMLTIIYDHIKVSEFTKVLIITIIFLTIFKQSIAYMVGFYGLEIYDYKLWNVILNKINDFSLQPVYVLSIVIVVWSILKEYNKKLFLRNY